MAISRADRLAALEIACRAEFEALERSRRSGNTVAASINQRRLVEAEKRLEAAAGA